MALRFPALGDMGLKVRGAGQAALAPQPRLAGPMPWVIAIMVALTVIATATGAALRNLTNAASDELSGGVTVQIVEANPDVRDDQARRAAARLRATPGVESARIVSQDQLQSLIEPWLGPRGAGDDAIPVPALIDARVDGVVGPEMLGALRRSIREIAPAARIDAQSTWLRPVFGAVSALQWLALTLIVLLGGATAAAVLLAVRTALGANRETIEIVHLLGGTDRQIARVFQLSVGIDAAVGGVAGFAVGLAIVLFLGNRFSGLGAGLIEGGALGWIDWTSLVLVPIAGLLLAVATARLTVLRALRRML